MKLLRDLSLASIIFVLFHPFFAQASQAGISLNLEMEHSTVKIGSSITGKVVVTNISNRDVQIYKDKSGDAHQSGFTMEVRDTQGNTPGVTIEGSTIFGSGGTGILKPGGTMEFTLDIGKLCHIKRLELIP